MSETTTENSSIYHKLTNPFKPFVIAEVGSNHMGNMETAKAQIKAAKEAGCDAVKFQSWQWDTLEGKKVFESKLDYSRPGFDVVGYENVKRLLQLTPERHKELKDYADQLGIIFCSSPFSNDQIDLLVNLNVPFLKIASADVTNHELLKHAAETGKPILLSTGMADLAELAEAVQVLQGAGNNQIILLHCVSQYPTANSDINLNNIPYLAKTFGLPVGFSDHTLSTVIPAAAVSLGATVIEKHFRLENQECREMKVSIEPGTMQSLVENVHSIAGALGNFERKVSEAEIKARTGMRRSVVISRDCPAGTEITPDLIAFKRPGNGVQPKNWRLLLGRKTKQALVEGDLLQVEDLE